MRVDDIYLGQIVQTSLMKNAPLYMVKKIDTEEEQVFLIDIEDPENRGWCSFVGLFYVQGEITC